MSVGIKGPKDAGSHVCQELTPYTLYVLKTSDISLCDHGGLIPSSRPLSKLLACLSTRGRQGKGERKGIFKVYLVLCRRLWPKTGYGTSWLAEECLPHSPRPQVCFSWTHYLNILPPSYVSREITVYSLWGGDDNFYSWLKAGASLPGAATTTTTTQTNNKKSHRALRPRAQKVWAEIGGWCPGNFATWPVPPSSSIALPGPIKHWKKILKNNSFAFGGILSNLGASEPRDKRDLRWQWGGAGEGKSLQEEPGDVFYSTVFC